MWFYHFGIANRLQNKIDADFYAIIDAEDKAKKFFLEQKFINFKKQWFFLDQIEPSKIYFEKDYLKNFEKKYQVNLWQIIFGDKYFYQYNQFHKFSHDEIMSILYQECKFFENMLEEIKPQFLLTFNPITHYNILLHRMCLNSGITPIVLAPGRLGKRTTISKIPFTFDESEFSFSDSQLSDDKLENFLEKYNPFNQAKEKRKANFEENKFMRYSSILKFLISTPTQSHKKRFGNIGKTKSSVLSNKINNVRQKKIRTAFINKNLLTNFKNEKPFVYFPLHYEPERVLLVDAPFYSDQIPLIANIAKSLPVKYQLLVKEHPMMQTIGWRDTSFYEKIMDLPNVKLVHPSIHPSEIIKASSLVIAIAGTSCIEAAFYKKPSIVFTNQFYSLLSSVTTIENIQDLPNAIKSALNSSVDDSSLRKFIKMYEQNSVEFNFLGLAAEFANKFGFKGPVMDAVMKQEDVELFLNKHNQIFEKLSEHHLKKIQSYI